MSARWKRGRASLLKCRQPKGPPTVRLRPDPPRHLSTLLSSFLLLGSIRAQQPCRRYTVSNFSLPWLISLENASAAIM